MFGIFISDCQLDRQQNGAKYLHFLSIERIKYQYYSILRYKIITMAKLKDIFGKQEGGISRRGLLHSAAATALLAAATVFPGAAMGGTTGQTSLQMRDEMDAYSRDPSHQGIGIFINLQADATLEQGQALGDNMKRVFASRGVPVEYRLNQSRGTATDLTFYVKGFDFTINVADLKRDLRNVLAHHGDVWPRRTSALTTLDQ